MDTICRCSYPAEGPAIHRSADLPDGAADGLRAGGSCPLPLRHSAGGLHGGGWRGRGYGEGESYAQNQTGVPLRYHGIRAQVFAIGT